MSDATSDYELLEVLEQKRKDGSLIREKARVLVEEWLDRIYPRMVDPELSNTGLLEFGKALIELGDLKPKKDITQVEQGPRFSIQITIPQANGADPIKVEGTVSSDEQVIEGDFSSLPDVIPVFDPAKFQLTQELAGIPPELDDEVSDD